jgi:hypothetical protein
MVHSVVVPAKAGTHNPRTELSSSIMPLAKLTPSVLTNFRRGVWVPVFAGTTGRER